MARSMALSIILICFSNAAMQLYDAAIEIASGSQRHLSSLNESRAAAREREFREFQEHVADHVCFLAGYALDYVQSVAGQPLER
jgi:hypothetical protein